MDSPFQLTSLLVLKAISPMSGAQSGVMSLGRPAYSRP